MDVFPRKNQLINEKKKAKTTNFVARQKNNSDGKHSNFKEANHREKDWTNKALARDKHVRKCFVRDSENHLAAECLKNPN